MSDDQLRTFEFACDSFGCRRRKTIPQVKDREAARLVLKRLGWVQKDGMDLCPDHKIRYR